MTHQTNHKRLYNIIIIVFFVIVAITLLAMSFAYSSIRPIIYGIAIAYIFKPMCNAYYRWFYLLFSKKFTISRSRKAAHAVSIVCTYLTWGLIIYIFVLLVLPEVVEGAVRSFNSIPQLGHDIDDYIMDQLSGNEKLCKLYQNAKDEAYKYIKENTDISKLSNFLADIAGSVISGVVETFTFLFNFFIGLIVSVYVLIGRRRLGAQAKLILKSVFSKKASDLILEEVKFADRMFSKYFGGRIIDRVILGILCAILCVIFGIPYAMLISVIVGVANIIPFFGQYIGLVPTFIIVFAVSPFKALIYLVIMVILLQIDGNVIAPKIQGNSTGLSSFWVLFAILLFGGLFGFVGMFIGVPIFAVIYDIFGKLMRFCLHKRGEHEELKTYENEYLTDIDEDAETFFKRKMAEWREELQKRTKNNREAEALETAEAVKGSEKPKSAKRKTGKTSSGTSKKKRITRSSKKKEPDDVVDGVELTQVTFSDEGHE